VGGSEQADFAARSSDAEKNQSPIGVVHGTKRGAKEWGGWGNKFPGGRILGRQPVKTKIRSKQQGIVKKRGNKTPYWKAGDKWRLASPRHRCGETLIRVRTVGRGFVLKKERRTIPEQRGKVAEPLGVEKRKKGLI